MFDIVVRDSSGVKNLLSIEGNGNFTAVFNGEEFANGVLPATIPMPLDLDGNIKTGIYYISVNGTKYAFEYTYTPIKLSVSTYVDGFNSSVRFEDATDYLQNTIVSRKLSITTPQGITDVVSTDKVYTNIYSGVWKYKLEAGYYQPFPSNLKVHDYLSIEGGRTILNINRTNVFAAAQNLFDEYNDALINNIQLSERLENVVIRVNNLLNSFYRYVILNEAKLAYDSLEKVANTVSMPVTVEQIVPFTLLMDSNIDTYLSRLSPNDTPKLIGEMLGSTLRIENGKIETVVRHPVTVAGTYNNVTVDGFGQFVSGSNVNYQPFSPTLTELDIIRDQGVVIRDGSSFVTKDVVGTNKILIEVGINSNRRIEIKHEKLPTPIYSTKDNVVTSLVFDDYGHVTGIEDKPIMTAIGYTPENSAYKGMAGGYAPLDSNGKISSQYLSISGMTYKGKWDAATNTPTLANGVGRNGDWYSVTSDGNQLGKTWKAGDRAIYNGTVWDSEANISTVASVFGRTENIDALGNDYNNFYVRFDASQTITQPQANQAALNLKTRFFTYDQPSNTYLFEGKTQFNGDMRVNNLSAIKGTFSGLVSSDTYTGSGFTAVGWGVDEFGNANLKSLTVRELSRFYELETNKIRATNGSLAVTDAAVVKSINGNSLLFDDIPPFQVGDVLRAQRWGNGTRGFIASVAAVDTVAKTVTLGTFTTGAMDQIRSGDTVVRWDSSIESRRGLVYLTSSDVGAPNVQVLYGQEVKVQMGNLSGRSWNGTTIPNNVYGFWGKNNIYVENGYFSGTINVTGGNAETVQGSQAKIDSLQIGGVNRLQGSDLRTQCETISANQSVIFHNNSNSEGYIYTTIFCKQASSTPGIEFKKQVSLEAGTYAVSVYGQTDTSIGLYAQNASNSYVVYSAIGDANFKIHKTLLTIGASGTYYIYILFTNPAIDRYMNISWVKIEKGTKHTDWTPAPEDYGELAYANKVEEAMLGSTIITGGYIKSSLLDVNSIIVSNGLAKTTDISSAIGNKFTYITPEGVYTGTLTADQIKANLADIGGFHIEANRLISHNQYMKMILNGTDGMLTFDGINEWNGISAGIGKFEHSSMPNTTCAAYFKNTQDKGSDYRNAAIIAESNSNSDSYKLAILGKGAIVSNGPVDGYGLNDVYLKSGINYLDLKKSNKFLISNFTSVDGCYVQMPSTREILNAYGIDETDARNNEMAITIKLISSAKTPRVWYIGYNNGEYLTYNWDGGQDFEKMGAGDCAEITIFKRGNTWWAQITSITK